jgi:low temperature requirement protein LtrA
LVIAHPRSELHAAGALVTLGGPALYLAGVTASAARIGHAISPARIAVMLVLAALIPVGARTTGLVAAVIVVTLLALLVVVEDRRPRAISARA